MGFIVTFMDSARFLPNDNFSNDILLVDTL
jgi:hypothetical protein